MTTTLVIMGPTASGKSALAFEIARRNELVELVSADSMQVYRGMDIGTAKPTRAEQAEVRHHVIDVADPADDYNVSCFKADALTAMANIRSRGGIPVIVGGTGLYLRSIVDDLEIPGRFPDVVTELDAEPDTEALHRRLAELDPIAASRVVSGNRRRVVRALEVTVGSGRPFSTYGPGLKAYPPTVPFRMVAIGLPRPVVDERISARYTRQLDAGFLAEATAIAASPGGISRTASQALGYKELFQHIRGEVTLDEAIDLAIRRTRRFARRQERWFRRDPRLIWHRTDQNPMELLDAVLGDFDSCN